MRVYRINNDVDRYQCFLPARDEDLGKLSWFDCTPRLEGWNPPEVFVLYPRYKAGDFYQFDSSILITSPRATSVLRRHLERAGELLPLPYKGMVYTVLNVTECIDVLDTAKSEFVYSTTGRRRGITRYAFRADRFTETSLFKIPETDTAEILAVEGMFSLGDFREAVEKNGLQGLFFTELWNDSA